MPPHVATVVYVLLILVLFWLDRDPKDHTSGALWIPSIWLLLIGSRPISAWLQGGQISVSADQMMEGSPLDASIFAALLVAGIIVLVGRKRRLLIALRANRAILLYFTYCALSILWSDYPFVAFKRWIKALGDVAMVLVILTDRDQLGAIKRVLARGGIVLFPLSILLIKYYPDIGRSYDPWLGTQYFSGITMQKNMLGMVCLAFGLGAWWRFLEDWRSPKGKDRTMRLTAQGAVLAMGIWLLNMSNSLTSLTCLAMAGSLIAVTRMATLRRNPAMVNLLVTTAVVIPFTVLFLGVGGGALQSMGRDPTLTGRTVIWHQVIQIASNPLCGAGFESFWLGDRLQKLWSIGTIPYGINEAHNGYIEVYLNLGWIGVALLAVLIVTGYRKAMAAFRRDPDSGSLRLAFFVAALIQGFTEAAFRSLSLSWFSFLLATTAAPGELLPQGSPAREIEPAADFAAVCRANP